MAPRVRHGARVEETRSWREHEFLVLDLETSGLDPRTSEILSFGFVTVSGGRIEGSTARHGLVAPTRRIPDGSIKIHSLRPLDLRSAPPLSAAVEQLEEALRDRVLVAHAAWIEQGFLRRSFSLCDRPRPAPRVLDTACLARALGWAPRNAGAEPGLEWLATTRRLPVHTPHQALGDAMTTAGLFLAECHHLGSPPGAATLRELLRISRHWRLR